jgi:hypothetical protein
MAYVTQVRNEKRAKTERRRLPVIVVGIVSTIVVVIAAVFLFGSFTPARTYSPEEVQRMNAARAAEHKTQVEWYRRTHPRQ